MIIYPDKPWFDKQTFNYVNNDGEKIVAVYNYEKNSWTFSREQEGGSGGGGDIGTVTTEDVQTTPTIPTPPPGWTGLNTREDLLGLNEQKSVNWFFADEILSNKEGLEKIIWVNTDPPEDENYLFWFDTNTLELLFNYEGQWFPVSIPPSQINVLSEILDGIQRDVVAVRGDIVLNKKDIDDIAQEVSEIGARLDSNDSSLDNAAYLNQDNTFASNRTNDFKGLVQSNKMLTIMAPPDSYTEPTFEIRGTARTGTQNSRVLRCANTNGKLAIFYRGPIAGDDEIVNKAYVDGKARASEIVLAPEFEDPDPTSTFRDDDDDAPVYQDDLNIYQAQRIFDQRRKQTRVQTNVDFNQNTIIDGEWVLTSPDQGTAFPEDGQFMALNGEGNPTTQWDQVVQLRINGTDYNDRQGLADLRKGAVIIIQDVVLNTFAQYSCTNFNMIGNPQGGQFWVEMDVRVYIGRALGVAPAGEVCEIRITSPHPAVSTFGEPPVVSDDGFLWYNEENKTLYVSDWDDNQDNNGDAVWIPVGGEEAFLPLAGGAMTGVLNMQDNYIANVHDPESATDAVNRRYTESNFYGKNKRINTTEPVWIRPLGPDGNPQGPSGGSNMLVVNQLDSDTGSIVRFCKGGEDVLKVTPEKKLDMQLNPIVQIATPEADNLTWAANVNYVNTAVQNASAKPPAPGSRFTCVPYQNGRVYEPGQISWYNQYAHIYFHSIDADGREVFFPAGTSGASFTSTNYVKVWDENFNLIIYYKASELEAANTTYRYNIFRRETDYVKNDLIAGNTYYLSDSLYLP